MSFPVPIILFSILTPLLGAVLVVSTKEAKKRHFFTSIACGLTLLSSLIEWQLFTRSNSPELHAFFDPLSLFDQNASLVIDYFNAPLITLCALIFFAVIIAKSRAPSSIFSIPNLLIIESITLATLHCNASSTLVVLLVLSTIPPFLEMRCRKSCTRVYVLYMGVFVTLLVSGWILHLTQVCQGPYETIPIGLMTAAILLRSGITPVHSWMHDFVDKVSLSTAIVFLTPLTGAYALIRLILPIAPGWALESISMLSLFCAVYAAGMAIVQTDARKLFCFLFLSHASLISSGLELGSVVSLTGALCVWGSIGLSLTGFGIVIQSLEARIGRISLRHYHGLYQNMPTLAGFFLLTGLASIGFPATLGFIGMELLIDGAVKASPLIGVSVVVATALNGIAILHAYFRIFTGKRHPHSNVFIMNPYERITVMILSALLIGGGLYPQPGVDQRYHAAHSLIGYPNDSNSLLSTPP